MRKYNLFVYATLAFIIALGLSNTVVAQYWFQTGARGANSAGFNNGAGVTIQTVYQEAFNGSLGFWVGESLSNGAFIQVGYEITNSTGYYSSSCLNSTKSTYLQAGVPTWFWEYFLPSSNDNQSFCGGIGPNGSAGLDGSYNTYSFKSSGSVWNAYFNDQLIGSIDLGVSNSGPNPPSALAEYADTNTNKNPMENVTFKNLFFYIGDTKRTVPQGYSSVSYGVGSLTNIPNPYGIEELGNRTNYFVIGSSIPAPTGQRTLWKLGYGLDVSSAYGNITGTGNYIAYSIVPIAAPSVVNISNGTREMFRGWTGSGYGSYTGTQPMNYITMYGNITETASWARQYYLNATSEYGKLTGSGWYDANSMVTLTINSNIIMIGSGSRVVFSGWSNNDTSNSITMRLESAESVHAIWERQYYVNATSEYGKLTGSGWYDANSIASISLNSTVVPINSTQRLAFRQWSNGYEDNNISIAVNSPIALKAIFEKQYLITLMAENSNGKMLSNVSYYNVSSSIVDNGSVFVFPSKVYNIEYMDYKGVIVTIDHSFEVNESRSLRFKTPVYDIAVYTKSVFGTPINASLNITFKNNTNINTHSGSNGTAEFRNVPYGYVTGYAEYFGLKQSVNLSYGVDSDLTFFTASLMAFIIGGIMLIVAVAKVASYLEGKRMHKGRRSAK